MGIGSNSKSALCFPDDSPSRDGAGQRGFSCSNCGARASEPFDEGSALLCKFQKDFDNSAFVIFLKEHQERLLRTARQLCQERHLPLHLEEDIVQIALVKVVRSIDSFDCTRPVWPWLHCILRNAATDEARCARPVVNVSSLVDEERCPGVARNVEPQDHREASDLDFAIDLSTFLQQCPDVERRIIEMKLAGHGMKEISATVDWSVRTTSRVLVRLRSTLRGWLQRRTL